jgi:hypothetical protein
MFHKILYAVIAIVLTACANQSQTTSHTNSNSSIRIPKNFYAEELGQCRMSGYRGNQITSISYKDEIDLIVGFDWQKHHTENSTSLSVNHRPLSRPLAYLSAATHQAVYSKNPEEMKIAIDYIYKIAKGNQFMNTLTYEEGQKTLCYAGNNNTTAPCPIHAPQHLAHNLVTYMISALWVKDYFNKEQYEVVDSYIKRAYIKYIEPSAISESLAFGEMANEGIGRLAYAAWTKDYKLAQKEFDFRFNQMDQNWEDDGYIKGNSYRGVRGVFYHSMGVDIALGYIQLANAWGYKVPEKLMVKVKKSAELINTYINNPKDYYNYPDSKISFNASKNPADAAGIHPQALGLKALMKNIVHIDLKSDPVFEGKIRSEFIDVMLGFNPKCMFPE